MVIITDNLKPNPKEFIMKTLKTFNAQNISNTKQFKSALSTVFQAIGARNEQIQQLLLVAVNEATGSNNLSWLTEVLHIADATKGVNGKAIAKYVKEVLCCNTVAITKDGNLKKSSTVDSLMYDIAPSQTWYEYKKQESSVKAAFAYDKRITSAIESALDKDKGGLSRVDVLKAILATEITASDLIEALDQLETEVEPNF